MLSLLHKCAVSTLHLLASLACGPKLAKCALAHPCSEVIIEVWIVCAEVCNQLLNRLARGVAVVRAGGGDRREAVVLNRVDDLLLAKVDKGADDGDIRLVEVGLGAEGVQLPRVEQAHEKGLHGIIMVMRVGDLIHLVRYGVAVDCAAPKERAGEAGAFVVLLRNRTCDIDIHNLIGDIELLAECCNRIGIKRIVKLRIDGECRDGKISFQTLAQDGERVGEKDAVLAARYTDQDAVALLDQLELHDGTHELAEIGLWNVDIHEIKTLPLLLFFMAEIDTEDAGLDGDGKFFLPSVFGGELIADRA